MYSAEVTKRDLDWVQDHGGKNGGPLPFSLTYHTRDRIRTSIKYFNDLKDDSGKLTRDFDRAENEWVFNEQTLCKYDFSYYLRNYYWIKSTLGSDPRKPIERESLFVPNVPQRIVMRVWGEEEAQYHPIMMMQNKARQLGVTSLTEAAIAHRVQFYGLVNALVASSTEDKTREMSSKMVFAWDRMPYWLMPANARGPLESGELLVEFRDLDSAISLQWGNQITGVARGRTPDIAHLSEVSEWKTDPWQAIGASLMRAFHPEPSSFMIWESTAAGIGELNFWYQKWLFYMDEWSKGNSAMRPIFLPWFVGTDVWPTRTWTEQHKHQLVGWIPQPETVAHAKKARDYVLSDSLLKRELVERPGKTDWTMPPVQQLFWEIERAEAKAGHKLNLFHQEMPATWQESFQNTKMSVFEVEEIELLESECNEPLAIYGIQGTGIRTEFNPLPKYIDYDKIKAGQGFTYTFNAQTLTDEITTSRMRFEFIPLKHTDWRTTNPSGRLFVWRKPTAGVKYHLGVDVCYGMDQDRSVVSVLSEGTVADDAHQCAEYVNPRMNSVDIAPIVLAVGLYYTVKDPDGELAEPRYDIECNANGEATQHLLKVLGVMNFHRWERYDNMKRVIHNKLGWFTNSWSRPMIIDHVNNAIRERHLRLNSPWLIGELKTLEKDWDEQFARATHGAHDDRYIGVGIAYFCAHAWKPLFQGRADVFLQREAMRHKESILDPAQLEVSNVLPHPGMIQEINDYYSGTVDQYYRSIQDDIEESELDY